ncbi:hypothetical protein ACHAW6_002738 [Cyclotella cf. meneghiniana]
MSLRSFNSPPLVAAAGISTLVGIPFLEALTFSASTAVLKGLNLTAFAANVVAVSIPGRLDGQQDAAMRSGNLNPAKPNASKPEEGSPLIEESNASTYSLNRSRTLVNPRGWAFAIWGPIYLGEAAFVTAQLFASDTSLTVLSNMLPNVTAPFVAANLFQSLWCASFRPNYGEGWKKYVSVGMLAGTAYSLSLVNAAGYAALISTGMENQSYLLWPLAAHFGWTSAATLVNLNGSVASDKSVTPRTLVAIGHSSAVLAATLGVGITLAMSMPVYGVTLSWALAACADGMSNRTPVLCKGDEDVLSKAAVVQRKLCWTGSVLCAVAAVYVSVL